MIERVSQHLAKIKQKNDPTIDAKKREKKTQNRFKKTRKSVKKSTFLD